MFIHYVSSPWMGLIPVIEDNLGLISSVCKCQSHLQSTFMSARRFDSVAVFSIGR